MMTPFFAPTPEDPIQAPKFVEYEGFLVSEDGEIIGVVLPDGSYEMYPVERVDVSQTDPATGGFKVEVIAPKTPWIPKTEGDALWVMERRSDIRAKIERAKIQETEVAERMRAKRAKIEKDLERFDKRFAPDLLQIAKSLIFNQSKGQTWATPYGSVSMSNVSAKVKAAHVEGTDEGTIKRNAELEKLRIAWAKNNCPVAIEAYKPPPAPRFMISLVPKGKKADLIADPEYAQANGFVYEPAGTKIEINQ